MNLSRWMLVYLVTGSKRTERTALAFYGGGLVLLALAAAGIVILAAAGILIIMAESQHLMAG